MDTYLAVGMPAWMTNFADSFHQNFIEKNRYQYYLDGIVVTLQITIFAVLIGIFIGTIVGIIRSSHDNTGKLKIANKICKIYLTVIRGTPVVVQLMLIYYGILQCVNFDPVLVASIAFGINSGAYVAEIVRGGIMSIDEGQVEAGRSLGFNYIQTMRYVILPQALKNVLPALGNEFIVLLKETSVAGYIALQDLTKAGDIVRSQTYASFMPMLGVAVIYLVMVMIFSYFVQRLERRLKNGTH